MKIRSAYLVVTILIALLTASCFDDSEQRAKEIAEHQALFAELRGFVALHHDGWGLTAIRAEDDARYDSDHLGHYYLSLQRDSNAKIIYVERAEFKDQSNVSSVVIFHAIPKVAREPEYEPDIPDDAR